MKVARGGIYDALLVNLSKVAKPEVVKAKHTHKERRELLIKIDGNSDKKSFTKGGDKGSWRFR